MLKTLAEPDASLSATALSSVKAWHGRDEASPRS
jgi:hypothetical protein